MAIEKVFDYSDAPTIRAFNKSNKFFRMIIGPLGSGKSSGCVAEIIDRAMQQKPGKDGIRRTRWAVVRNTYSQLIDTTIKTFHDWLPPDYFGTYKVTNYTYTIDKLPGAEIEVIFRALDRPEHVRNLLSLELTGAWFNEIRETPWAIVEVMEGRVGRYPAKKEGGPTWSGIIADTNPPDTDSRIYKLFEEEVPKNPIIASKYQLFKQPSGKSDKAENKQNLIDGYYENLAIGKDHDFIKVYIDGEYGYIRDGKSVYSNYNDTLHYVDSDLQPIKSIPLIIGMDFALNPSAVISQVDHKSRMTVFKEFCGEDMGLRRFINDILKPFIFNKYRNFEFVITGDPAGVRRQDTDERSCFDELKLQGLPATPCKTNSFMARYNAVDVFLTKLVEGKPAFQLTNGCPVLRKGFLGEYKLKKYRTLDDTYAESPVKNLFSHPHDALQYGCLLSDMSSSQIIRGAHSLSAYRPSYVSSRQPSISAWT